MMVWLYRYLLVTLVAMGYLIYFTDWIILGSASAKSLGLVVPRDKVQRLLFQENKDPSAPIHSDSLRGRQKPHHHKPSVSSPDLHQPNSTRAELTVASEEDEDTLHHSGSLLRCDNQTSCIRPELQLKSSFKIYLCQYLKRGIRFYHLVRESLLLHPMVEMVESREEADFLLYLPLSTGWYRSECNDLRFMNKTIILDEGDPPELFEPGEQSHIETIHKLFPVLAARNTYYHMFFKRSAAVRQAGNFIRYGDPFSVRSDIFPMTYTIMESYVKPTFASLSERDYEVVCTLRGSGHDPARLRVQQWVQEYGKVRNLTKWVGGQVSHASRTTIDGDYFGMLRRAQIVVTCNPSGWEGDYRLMETMASGPLVFVDQMQVPRPHPLVHKEHVVYYDNTNKTALFDLLDHYLANLQESRRIAVKGYIRSMQHHRAVNLIDYVLRTVEHRRLAEEYLRRTEPAFADAVHIPESAILNLSSAAFSSPYSSTGYDMRRFIIHEMNRTQGVKSSGYGQKPPEIPMDASDHFYRQTVLGFDF